MMAMATTITTISNCIPSIANLRFADSAISSAFTFEDVAIAINAGSIINPTFTANVLGLNRATLRKKLHKYNITEKS